MVRLLALAVSAVFVLMACAMPVPPQSQPAPQQPSRSQPRPAEQAPAVVGPTMADHLEDHFGKVTEARMALIDGDLRSAGDIAATLESLDPVNGLPPSWRPWYADTRSAARRIRDASTVEDAGRGIAEAARACAGCHQENRLHLVPEPIGPNPGAPDAMWRVRQAEEALWFDLTAPDDARWHDGAVALAGDPLLSDTAQWAALRPAEERMRDMATAAGSTRGLEDRARAYGRLLAACATCHARERP